MTSCTGGCTLEKQAIAGVEVAESGVTGTEVEVGVKQHHEHRSGVPPPYYSAALYTLLSAPGFLLYFIVRRGIPFSFGAKWEPSNPGASP